MSFIIVTNTFFIEFSFKNNRFYFSYPILDLGKKIKIAKSFFIFSMVLRLHPEKVIVILFLLIIVIYSFIVLLPMS